MKKFLLPVSLIFIICTAFTRINSTVVRSAITFKIRNLGINVDGSFSGLQADVHFDPSDPSSATIEASVDASTVNTGNSSRDEHLRSEDYFDAAHYPKITLKSVSIKHRSGDKYTGQFNLTIKGNTQSVEIPFTFSRSGDNSAFKGSFKINRRDFSVGGSSLILSDDVTVNIDAEVKD
ncbi:MAG TPA: YceI family protein [Mucilaginibacter sp.]|nr:YceI family protein [Mucilaginibacter sp.]